MELKNHSLFIALEGCDGVGKTSIGKGLAAAIGAKYYRSPGEPFQSIREAIDEIVDPITRFYFFRAAIQHDSAIIRKLLLKNSVIIDRYYTSTNLIHSILDSRVDQLINNTHLLIPDQVIVLTSSREVIRQRLAKRNSLKRYEDNEDLQCRIDQQFTSLGYPVVDTSNLTVEQGVLAVIAKLGYEKGANGYVKKY